MVIYNSFHTLSDMFYPNYHQFQFDDIENNSQYILTSKEQFYKNLFSGDSTINADIVLFSIPAIFEDKLNACRTFNIIKSYIGFTKRDLKNFKQNKGKNKLFHAERSLYCADCLTNNELPDLNRFKDFLNQDFKILEEKEKFLRKKCNELFEKNELTIFPKLPIVEPFNYLERLLIESNNIKEFKY